MLRAKSRYMLVPAAAVTAALGLTAPALAGDATERFAGSQGQAAGANPMRHELRYNQDRGGIFLPVFSTRRAALAGPRGLDWIEIRQALWRQGFRRIHNIRFVSHVRNDHFTAAAWRGGVKYFLRINDDTGRVMRMRRIF